MQFAIGDSVRNDTIARHSGATVATDIPDLVARVFDIGDIILSAAARTSEAIVIGARRSRGSMQLIIENLYVVEWPAISTSCVGLTGDKYLRTILSRILQQWKPLISVFWITIVSTGAVVL